MLEHPDITRILATGYPWPLGRGRICQVCGCQIREDELYYDIFGHICCPECVETFRHYA